MQAWSQHYAHAIDVRQGIVDVPILTCDDRRFNDGAVDRLKRCVSGVATGKPLILQPLQLLRNHLFSGAAAGGFLGVV